MPGSVHDDLIRAGLIRDPNFGLASLQAEWVSARQWVYRRTFRVELPGCRRLQLRFDGSDYGGQVYLNGERLGALAGTHTPVWFDVSGLDVGAEHLLAVVLAEPPPEDGQLGRTSRTHTLKPRYGYGWDFSTRLIHVGLWRGVTLLGDQGTALRDLHVRTHLREDHHHAEVDVQLELDGDPQAPITAELTHPDGRVERQQVVGRTCRFPLADPELWWPVGLGGQPLYRLRAWVDGAAPLETRFGVREVQLVHNVASLARGARPYTLQVNGQPLYARGFNVVPADLLPGREGMAGRERRLVELAHAAHANLLRVNGVGGLASEAMLDRCDELGLMVWQEMPLSSSGSDNVPPDSPEFLAALERDLPALVRGARHHPCVVLLGGGNELTDEQRQPASEHQPTLARIAAIIAEHDGTRPFVPTSPSGPEYDLRPEVSLERPQDQHDVHGPWHYRGVHDSYRPYSVSRALMHSEFGCQAASREATLRRYLTDGPVWPMDDRNPQVVHHGDWWLMRHRIEEVFGPVEDLGRYVRLTQAVQADVLRHALACNRARPDECSAALVWQLNEPWPNAHNTSVIDYDLNPKLAYYRCRELNAPVALHLGLPGLPGPVAAGALTLQPRVLADRPGHGQLSVTLHDLNGGVVHHQTGPIGWPAAGAPFTVALPDGPALLRAELHGPDGTRLTRTEQWVAHDRPQPFAPLATLGDTTLSVERQADRLLVRNTGTTTALWISVEGPPGAAEPDDSGFSLLPGEQRHLGVMWVGPHGPLTVQALNTLPLDLHWSAP
ncbi:glycoside hydrolase family 2 protein [Deinococcus sonorensis]|uniref:beta-mannosidase n=1 Tax=Deinococcus sonorensis KR-87 TaxID=694439 RepID=A0AAU7UFJ5_9DEIO